MNDCERFRELLVELAYDEIEADDERRLLDHLAECEPCAARRDAFAGVRADLQEWTVEPPRESRVTFVAMPAARPTSVWTRRLAAAASFIVGFLLIAAAANTEIHNSGDGWTIRTSLLPAATESAEPATSGDRTDRPTSGPVERIEADQPNFGVPVSQGGGSGRFRVDSWLDQRLQARGVEGAGDLTRLSPEQVRPLLDDLMRERDQQIRTLIENSMARAENRTRDEFDAALTGLYQAMEAQRTNDLLFFAGELGLLQEATGQELQRTNAAIDLLIGLEAAEPPTGSERERQDPERRQEPQR